MGLRATKELFAQVFAPLLLALFGSTDIINGSRNAAHVRALSLSSFISFRDFFNLSHGVDLLYQYEKENSLNHSSVLE